ncbi:MAG: potassium-transporting ATPase subunit KdpC [Deltaproteobacteria bacterium]|nr:potassium-transporting ATPase subunit KdpC [Deltaproteobacteria bacterium]
MKAIRTAMLLFICLTVTAGVIYPGVVTLIGQLAFPRQAMGNLVQKADGSPAGSLLIGQPFSDPKYFWSRPSATSDFPYNPLASGGSNLGPTNPDLLKQVADRVAALKASGLPGPAPADLVMASGSGLDPHIRLETALLQVYRVAGGRGLQEDRLRRLVQEQAEGRQLGFLGVDRVNVVKLNLALDNLK